MRKFLYGRRDEQPPIRNDDHHLHREDKIPISGPRGLITNPRYDHVRENTGASRNRNAPRELAFHPAVARLYKTLGAARDFYREFSRRYDEETHGIKPYAGSGILDVLWAIKAKMNHECISQDPQMAWDNDARHSRPSEPLVSPAMGFRKSARNMQEAFEMAIDAGPPFQRAMRSYASTIDKRRISRILRKLEAAFRDLGLLIEVAHERQPPLKRLITQIDSLLIYLDGKRGLWAPADMIIHESGGRSETNPDESESGAQEPTRDTGQGQSPLEDLTQITNHYSLKR
ncbi:hypothetical protein MMC16_007612 [Acarospora aff. strigata]|nr:hypothetical protein [Acarospora aff. strigata]